MKEKKPTKNYEDLPDTIGIEDYMEWRGVGDATARNIFNSKDFPRLQGTGVKQLADKRAVLLHELGLPQEQIQIILIELGKKLV